MMASCTFSAAAAAVLVTFAGSRSQVSAALKQLRRFSLPLRSCGSASLLISSRNSPGGACTVTVEALKRSEENGVVAEEVKHIMDLAKRASTRREIFNTDFITPPVLKEATNQLEKLADVKAIAQGGYPEAERCRISIGHPEVMTTTPDAITALRISGNFGFGSYHHGDFLGSILGTGIAREKIGDILLQGEKGAQVLVVPELVDFLVSTLNKVANVPVSCAKIPLLALEYEPPKMISLKTVEASLRVDALASAGFKISRTKLVDLIRTGDVRVNWSTVTKNGSILKTGDIVSVSGKGRLEIGEIVTTRKGKFAVNLIRYV